MVYTPFCLVFPSKWYTPSVTSGSGDRQRKEGCRGGGVHSFLPGLEMCKAHPYSDMLGREPENGKVLKVVRRGSKRSFEPRERKWGCTGVKWGRAGAKRALDGANDSWEIFPP